MKNMALSGFGLYFAVLSLLGSCASASGSTNEDFSVPAAPWKTLEEACKPERTCDGNGICCTKDGIADTYDNLVNLQKDLEICKETLDGQGRICMKEKEILQGRVQNLENDLDKWYRKWYIILPLGILLGGAAGFAAGVAK